MQQILGLTARYERTRITSCHICRAARIRWRPSKTLLCPVMRQSVDQVGLPRPFAAKADGALKDKACTQLYLTLEVIQRA